jgi:hypothetical protein
MSCDSANATAVLLLKAAVLVRMLTMKIDWIRYALITAAIDVPVLTGVLLL